MNRLPSKIEEDPMAEVRQDIDRIDREIVSLLVARAACIDRAIAVKAAHGLPPLIEARVEEVLARVRRAAAEGGLDPALVTDLWQRLISWSIAREAAVLCAEDEAR